MTVITEICRSLLCDVNDIKPAEWTEKLFTNGSWRSGFKGHELISLWLKSPINLLKIFVLLSDSTVKFFSQLNVLTTNKKNRLKFYITLYPKIGNLTDQQIT